MNRSNNHRSSGGGQPPAAAVPSRRRQAVSFTLIELIVAMSCFTLIVFALMSYLSTAQNAWSQSSGNCSVYENAQFVFDVIGKDLQCAVASSREGEKVPFLYTSTVSFIPTSDYVAFIACVSTNDTTSSDLSKIKYTYQKGDGGTGVTGKDRIIRSQAIDSSDFFNPGAAKTWATGITTSTAALVSGVANFSMICYADNAGTVSGTGTNSFQLPYAVNVSITLYDETKASTNADINKTTRTFSRLFFIGGSSGANSLR